MAETVTVKIDISIGLLRDLLCTAVEGGSNYWATFHGAKRTPAELDYLSVGIVEHEAHSETTPQLRRRVTAEDLAKGLEALARAPFPSAGKHLGDALSENGDAITADVVLQMTVFGELIYS